MEVLGKHLDGLFGNAYVASHIQVECIIAHLQRPVSQSSFIILVIAGDYRTKLVEITVAVDRAS